MEQDNQEITTPLQSLASIADQFMLFKPERLSTEIKIKLNKNDYLGLVREVENITNVGGSPDATTFSIDIDNVTFVFIRD